MSKKFWMTGLVPATFTPMHEDGRLNPGLRILDNEAFFRLHADEIRRRLTGSQLADEIALARAQLHKKRRLPAEYLGPMSALRLSGRRILWKHKRIKIMDGRINPRLSP